MDIIEKGNISGKYDIYINKKFKESVKNRIMNTVLDQIIEAYQGVNPDLEIKYLALGTSNTSISDTDTVLGAEIFRTPIVTQSKTGTGEIQTDFTVLSTEAIGQIEEIGIFGGTSASGTVDTGTLISRILWSHDKTSSEEIAFKRTDKIIRG